MSQKSIIIFIIAVFVIGAAGYFALSESPLYGTKISYEDLSTFKTDVSLACISTSDSFEDREVEFVINTESEYQKLLGYKLTDAGCKDFTLPSIDFSQKTLLGKLTFGGGCSVDFVKKVYRDSSRKQIIYLIDVVEKGSCEKGAFSMNWILVPKVPSDYTVQFQVK